MIWARQAWFPLERKTQPQGQSVRKDACPLEEKIGPIGVLSKDNILMLPSWLVAHRVGPGPDFLKFEPEPEIFTLY